MVCPDPDPVRAVLQWIIDGLEAARDRGGAVHEGRLRGRMSVQTLSSFRPACIHGAIEAHFRQPPGVTFSRGQTERSTLHRCQPLCRDDQFHPSMDDTPTSELLAQKHHGLIPWVAVEFPKPLVTTAFIESRCLKTIRSQVSPMTSSSPPQLLPGR